MVALVPAGLAAEVGCGAFQGDCPFVESGDCGGVVAEGVDGGERARVVCRDQVELGQDRRLFEVAVGDRASRIGGGDDSVLHRCWERVAPDVALTGGIEVDPAHADFCRVGGSQEGRKLWDQLREVCRPGAEAGRQASELMEVVTEMAVDPDPVGPGAVQGCLHDAQEACGAWDAHGDEAEAAQDALPFVVSDAATPLELFEEVGELFLAVVRKLDGLSQRVDHPPQQDLAGGPGSVALPQLFEGHGLVAMGFVWLWSREHLVDSVEKVVAQGAKAAHAPLSHLQEIINVDDGEPEGAL